MRRVLQQSALPIGEQREIMMPTGVLKVYAQPGSYSLDTLVGFAARANTRRGFLFVSKVLGKHWPARPAAMRELHAWLATQIPSALPGPVVFIALAETAIGLGQGVFEAYLQKHSGHGALFLHTTRYRLRDAPLVEFQEPHSHAPRQFLHLPAAPRLRHLFMQARSLVLVDDEVSTGNTFLNLAGACRALNPGIEHAHLVTLTDFLGDESRARLSQTGIPVTHSAALHGRFSFEPRQVHTCDPPAQKVQPATGSGASGLFGRLGTVRPLALPDGLADRLAQGVGSAQRVLVLGTGEFMHPAFLLACALERRGIDVFVQSTTRSPILQWGAIASALTFADNYSEGIANYIYNVLPGQYEHVFICHETAVNDGLRQLAASLHGRLLHFRPEAVVE